MRGIAAISARLEGQIAGRQKHTINGTAAGRLRHDAMTISPAAIGSRKRTGHSLTAIFVMWRVEDSVSSVTH